MNNATLVVGEKRLHVLTTMKKAGSGKHSLLASMITVMILLKLAKNAEHILCLFDPGHVFVI